MATQYLTRTRPFAVFVAAVLAFSIVQPALAQAPQPGGVPINTPTPDPNASLPVMAVPGAVQVQPEAQPAVQVKAAPIGSAASIQSTNTINHWHPTDSALNWAAHPLTFKPGKSAGYVAPTAPQYAADGAMIIDVLLIMYVPSGYGGGCCANQNARYTNLINWLENGSRWMGTGSRSIAYNVTSITVVLSESPHIGGNPAAEGDIGAVMNQIMPNACTYIANNPRPVQVWTMGTSRGHFLEWSVNGPRFTDDTTHNMPACSKTYTHFAYAYVGESYDGANDWTPVANGNMLEDHVHYWEGMLYYVGYFGYPDIACNANNPVGNLPGYNAATDFYQSSTPITSTTAPAAKYIYHIPSCATAGIPMGPHNNFMTRPTYYNGSWVSVGGAHFPDNKFPSPTDPEYDWYDTTAKWSHADTWWTQNYGSVTAVACSAWGCTQEGSFQRWFQHMPCRNTTALNRSGVNMGSAMGPLHYGWCGIPWLMT